MLKKCLLLILLVTLLTGCGPIYRTSYSYAPPTNQNGQMCTMQCLQTKNMCEQMCDMRQDNCDMRARDDARYRYRDYERRRREDRQPVDRSMDSFYYPSCNKDCRCVENYNDCFTLCGGRVLVHKTCQAFCNQ